MCGASPGSSGVRRCEKWRKSARPSAANFPMACLAPWRGWTEARCEKRSFSLVVTELVFARGQPPQAAYTFKHALVREAAYEARSWLLWSPGRGARRSCSRALHHRQHHRIAVLRRTPAALGGEIDTILAAVRRPREVLARSAFEGPGVFAWRRRRTLVARALLPSTACGRRRMTAPRRGEHTIDDLRAVGRFPR